jgi:ankyrin repeat protein
MQICGLFIKHHVDVNPRKLGGKWGTPLDAAIQAGHISVVQLLCDNGASVSPKGDAPIFTAARSEHANSYEILKTIIDHGADVNQERGAF